MSNTGIVGITKDIHQGQFRFQIYTTTCGKRFYRAIYSKVYLDGLKKAMEILQDFKDASPCAACGNVVTDLVEGECKECREE